MDAKQISLDATISREDNPKAVFLGDVSGVIHPLGLYLARRSVELFAGKQFSDAFFGDYFFYVGDLDPVKDFLEEKKRELPKTLLLLTSVSAEKELAALINKKPIKTVFIAGKTNLTDNEVQQIMDFFLGSSESIFNLSVPGFSFASLPDASSFTKIVPKTASAPILKTEIVVAETEVSPESLSQGSESQFPQTPPSETAVTIESFFKTGEPKSARPQHVAAKLVKTRMPLFVAAILTLLVLVVVPVIVTAATIFLGTWELSETKKAFGKNNISQAAQNLRIARVSWETAAHGLSLISPLLDIAHLRQIRSGLEGVVTIGNKTTAGLGYIAKAAPDIETLLTGVSQKNKRVAFAPLISQIKGSLMFADTELALAQAETKSPELLGLVGTPGLRKFAEPLKNFSRQLESGRALLLGGSRGLSVLPDFIGLYGKRTYLVVFQNNMELRPTGGFIGSFGLANFEDGVLKNFTINDVYSADGALKGHVDPPEPIRQYLGQEHWYLRDSNWDPDFPKTAERLMWFLGKELDISVDGVVALDLDTVKSLLTVTGPLTLPDYHDTVTSDNLFLKVQTETQNDFFPGSTQKKDILSSLSQILLEKLLRQDTSMSQVLTSLHRALDEKHLQIFLTKKNLEEVISQAGWAGKLGTAGSCDEIGCVADFVSVVDANLGVNKVNYFIKRSLSDEVRFAANGDARHTLTITYKNTSPKNSSLGGNYRNYYRVFVPVSGALEQVSVDGSAREIHAGGIGSETAVATDNSGNLSVFGGLVEVAPQTEKTVTLTYVVTGLTSQSVDLTYEYLHQKQSGTKADNLTVTLLYPPTWQVAEINREPSNVAGTTTLANGMVITYNTLLSEDYRLRAVFRR